MQVTQLIAILVSVVITLAALALVGQAVSRMVAVVRLGQPDPGRRGDVGARAGTTAREVLGHTRMLKWGVPGAAHWFVMIGFGALVGTLIEAYGELFNPDFSLPLIGGSALYGILVELIAATTLVGVLVLITIRQKEHPRNEGRLSRFFGSTWWQAYYVEATIVAIALLVLLLRAAKATLTDDAYTPKFLVSYVVTPLFSGLSAGGVESAIFFLAMLKIVVSMAWFIVIAQNLTMGIAWHRFTAFPNIFFKRNASGGTALGPLKPMMSGGKEVDFEDPGEDDIFGVGQVEHFTWKGLLDFTTCTECGRCQSQCPAWNTDKPLSPKLLILALREHAYTKAPYLLAGGGKDMAGEETGEEERLADVPPQARREAERPLVAHNAGGGERGDGVSGGTGTDSGDVEEGELGGVIDPDVLWSCTTCGACVEQCPVDIEHVDHIVDMRRYQVLIESAFPSELSGLFKNLENKGNPWGMNASARLDWAKDLPFEVKTVGGDVEDLGEVEYLFWVGCAGAFEDRAKKTTQAVAELLHIAEVDFAVLGDGETCSGDPARRAGNEFLFQMLAQQNVETLNEAGAKKVVVTCPHCFNTVGREYPQLGGHFEVVHHTQLLNRLVREGRLTPVQQVEEKITYHDPCYLGRHNGVYTPPRDLIGALPGVRMQEMPRNSERSFCCGAGGARMWMEERIGKRINAERTEEALATGAQTIASGCPFCNVMLSDSVTSKQSDGSAGEDVAVVDVARMLLRSVKGDGTPPPAQEDPKGGDPDPDPQPAGQPHA
jgi:Fe-S oxidoreductase